MVVNSCKSCCGSGCLKLSMIEIFFINIAMLQEVSVDSQNRVGKSDLRSPLSIHLSSKNDVLSPLLVLIEIKADASCPTFKTFLPERGDLSSVNLSGNW